MRGIIMDKTIEKIINKFSRLPQVEAITLAGSSAFGSEDESSDVDIDVYINEDIPVGERERIAKEFADYMEIDNQFWGPGDEWKLRNSEKAIDIIYLDMKWIKDYLERVVERHEASVGYTTCFWHNVVDSKIAFDRNGQLAAIQDKYNIKYPKELKKNIVMKNYPILRKNISSYYYQIEKAIKRRDFIGVNHRVAALLASYFDILFAINEIPHPGEKKLIKFINEKCKKMPLDMEKNVLNILNNCTSSDIKILEEINELVDNLDQLLMKEDIVCF
jgi:predicted nucleotidyltransferase